MSDISTLFSAICPVEHVPNIAHPWPMLERGKRDPMRIALHDADKNGFPNLALMKLSAWHKMSGDLVEWWNPLETYDVVYSSKVFTFTPECAYLPENTVRGGTGYGLYDDLPAEVDGVFPDYSIYPKCDYAIGFLTRGCIRNCPWCIVPRKEGRIRACQTWQEIKRPKSTDILFMDNNVLASAHGIDQMADMIGKPVRIDFNQGLDARLITPAIADIIARLRWIRFVRMSCDTDEMLDVVADRIALLGRHGIPPRKIWVYLLVQDIESAERRALALRDLGVEVFAQPYRDYENKIIPTIEQRHFARWVNMKGIFRTVKTFREYDESKARKEAKK